MEQRKGKNIQALETRWSFRGFCDIHSSIAPTRLKAGSWSRKNPRWQIPFPIWRGGISKVSVEFTDRVVGV